MGITDPNLKNYSARASTAGDVASIASFDQRILKWYKTHGRKTLPWQQNVSSYRVWVSEIMLQQTQVTTVIPYFERFMSRFPDITDLARANLDEVLHLWTGLGYYARARNLHKTAVLLHTRYKGIFPSDIEVLMELPGIGRSTAGAILALSQKQRHPILDGNVKRVLCRHFAIRGFPNDPKVHNTLWALSDKLTPKRNVHHYTQAMMDLGATLCTRTNPNCNVCPLATTCLAKAQDQVMLFPNKAPSKKKPIKSSVLLLLHSSKENAILLEKRPSKGIWGGLWSLPEMPPQKSPSSLDSNLNLKSCAKHCLQNFGLKVTSQKKLPAFRHTFTHFHLDITPVLCNVSKVSGMNPNQNPIQREQLWQSLSRPKNLGLAAPIKRLLEEIS